MIQKATVPSVVSRPRPRDAITAAADDDDDAEDERTGTGAERGAEPSIYSQTGSDCSTAAVAGASSGDADEQSKASRSPPSTARTVRTTCSSEQSTPDLWQTHISPAYGNGDAAVGVRAAYFLATRHDSSVRSVPRSVYLVAPPHP